MAVVTFDRDTDGAAAACSLLTLLLLVAAGNV